MTARGLATLRVGDVLRTPSGLLRTVRLVSRHRGRTYVAFAIRRCSWTRRPYTVYLGRELAGWTRTGRRRQLRSRVDRAIARELADRSRRTVTCCDVEGVS